MRATQGETQNPNDFIIISFGIKSKPKRCLEGTECSDNEIANRKLEKLITGKAEQAVKSTDEIVIEWNTERERGFKAVAFWEIWIIVFDRYAMQRLLCEFVRAF